MQRYIENIQQSIATSREDKYLSRLLVFGIDRDYTEIHKQTKGEEIIAFVDNYKDSWKHIESQIKVQGLDMICNILSELPDQFVKKIVIDSPDHLSGNLHEVFAACVAKQIDMLLVMGVTQKGSFFNYGRFLEARADEVWIEKAYRKKNYKEDPNSIYNHVSERAAGRCEVCGVVCSELEMHHVLSGKGRRKQQERPETVLMLCNSCHSGDHGVHGTHGHVLGLQLKKEVQRHYYSMDLSEDEIRVLMGGKLY